LADLPAHRGLVGLIQQCHGGGFTNYIVTNSTADAVSVAAAAIESQQSYSSTDNNWDQFSYDWISAQAGHQGDGSSLMTNPDTSADNRIQAIEAFNYALSIQPSLDSPNYGPSTTNGMALTM